MAVFCPTCMTQMARAFKPKWWECPCCGLKMASHYELSREVRDAHDDELYNYDAHRAQEVNGRKDH